MKAVFNNQFRLKSGKNKGQMRYAYKIVEATEDQLTEWIDHPLNAVNPETGVGPMTDSEGVPMYRHIDESLGKTGVVLIEVTASGAVVATSLAKEQQDAQLSVLKALAAQGIDTSAAAVMLAKEAGKDIVSSRFQLSTEPKAPVTKTVTPVVKKVAAKKTAKSKIKAEKADLNPFVAEK
jgi:hypothetical protein